MRANLPGQSIEIEFPKKLVSSLETDHVRFSEIQAQLANLFSLHNFLPN